MIFEVFMWLLLIALGAVVAGGFAVGYGLLQKGKVKQDRELIVYRGETDEARHRARILAIQRERELDVLLGRQLPVKSSASDEVDDETVFLDKKDIQQPADESEHWADQPPERADAQIISE